MVRRNPVLKGDCMTAKTFLLVAFILLMWVLYWCVSDIGYIIASAIGCLLAIGFGLVSRTTHDNRNGEDHSPHNE